VLEDEFLRMCEQFHTQQTECMLEFQRYDGRIEYEETIRLHSMKLTKQGILSTEEVVVISPVE